VSGETIIVKNAGEPWHWVAGAQSHHIPRWSLQRFLNLNMVGKKLLPRLHPKKPFGHSCLELRALHSPQCRPGV